MNRWTVHVKNFGKIEEAAVEIAPLTMFVGDNNSGKSYMMTLIYGLLNVRFFLDEYIFNKDSQIFRQCCGILEKMTAHQDTHNYILRGDEICLFQKLLNELLEDNKQRFMLSLFNKEMEIGKLWVTFPDEMELEFKIDFHSDKINAPEVVIRGETNDNSFFAGYSINRKELCNDKNGYEFFLSYILQCMLQWEMDAGMIKEKIYLPTARTGFLLTYKTLVGRAVQEKFTLEETSKNLLTKPNSDFLRELGSMDMTKERTRFQRVVEFIEKNLISGHVNVSDTPAQDFMYIPDGTSQKLPMYVTSAVVTEMTPLLLFLKYTFLGALMIEEPEISLHPQLQWQIARVLVQLVNTGMPVFVTTHSDIILQHINNMLKAGEMQNQEEFLQEYGYVREDLLSRNQIQVYQFDAGNCRKTKITKLPCGDYGFEAMTFYKTLQKLTDEIGRIENEG